MKKTYIISFLVIFLLIIVSYFGSYYFMKEKVKEVPMEKKEDVLKANSGTKMYTSDQTVYVLEKYDAHATFFVLGTNVERYPDEIKRMHKIGCEVGNHSYDHEDLSKLKKVGLKKQLNATNQMVQSITGQGVALMRPPYGAISTTMKKQLKQPMILWNIDTLDWKTRNAKKTMKAVMKDVKDGDIILMHDIHSETIDAAVKLIPKLQEKGYQLVTVSEMAAAKGIQLEAGERYTDF